MIPVFCLNLTVRVGVGMFVFSNSWAIFDNFPSAFSKCNVDRPSIAFFVGNSCGRAGEEKGTEVLLVAGSIHTMCVISFIQTTLFLNNPLTHTNISDKYL